jgi:hypothetical protein
MRKNKFNGTIVLYIIGCIGVVLKIVSGSTISWWIVTLPFWIVPAIALSIFALSCAVVLAGLFVIFLVYIFR